MIYLAEWIVSAAIVCFAGWIVLLMCATALGAVLRDMREHPKPWWGLAAIFGILGVLNLAVWLDGAAGSGDGTVAVLVVLAFTAPVAAVWLYRHVGRRHGAHAPLSQASPGVDGERTLR